MYRLKSNPERHLYCVRCVVKVADTMTAAERKALSRKRAREDPTKHAQMQADNKRWISEHRARIAEEKEQEEAHATARNAMYELEDAADLDEAREEAKVDAATGDVSTPNTLCSPSCLSVAR